MRAVAIAAVLLGVLACPGPARAGQADARGASQEPRRAVSLDELVLRDGSRLYGAVERETDEEVVFRTQAGLVVTVPRADVVRLRRVRGSLVDGEFRRADPNATRLFFAPTGRTVDRGQVYVGVFEFVMPFVQVGVTDRFSIGGGTPLVFGFDDNFNRPFWVTPKLQILGRDEVQVSVGAFHVFDTEGHGGGIAYGVSTFGRHDASVTVGAGLTYTGFDGGGGLLMLGGERQIGRSVKLLTENYVWRGGNGIASAGLRFFGERLSADVGLAFPLGADGLLAFPVVNFVYVF